MEMPGLLELQEEQDKLVDNWLKMKHQGLGESRCTSTSKFLKVPEKNLEIFPTYLKVPKSTWKYLRVHSKYLKVPEFTLKYLESQST